MKRILITGANSYIGINLESWLAKNPDKYEIDTIDMQKEAWKSTDFSSYDVVFHVAGIAHIKEDKNNSELYYLVNRDLAYEAALKAKKEGVKQYILLSSMSVYGLEDGTIDKSTRLNPNTNYGRSKQQAEEKIASLTDESFKVVTLRPPMVYGKGCKGNYPKLARVAKSFPVFPDIDNKRSMIHIDNLCQFIKLMIDNEEKGLFFPQNAEYVKTSELVRMIGEAHGNRVRLIKVFNPIIRLFYGRVKAVNKLFGNLVYDKSISSYKADYTIRSLEESIKETESL